METRNEKFFLDLPEVNW